MPTDIKTVMKMDNSDVEKKLKALDSAVKETYGDWIDATDELISVDRRLVAEKQKLTTATNKNSKEIKENIKELQKEKNAIRARVSARKSEMNILKQGTEETKKISSANEKAEKSTNSLTNSVVRHLRQLETMIVAYYTLSRGYQATIGKGIEVNRMMEDNTMGIAALLSANTRMVLSNGEVVNSYEKFILGQEIARKTMEDLRHASVKTFATFPQLTEIFQQAIGQTLSMGNAFGSTTDEIISNTVKLSQRMSNIGGAIGMPMDRIREEIRSLLSGNASTDSLISTMIFGSPGEANKAIRMAKERGKDGLTNMLNEVLKPFDALESVKTFSRSLLTFEDAYANVMRRIVDESGAFKDIQNMIDDLANSFNNNSNIWVKDFDILYKALKTLGSGISGIVSQLWDIGYAIGYGIAPYIQKLKDMTPGWRDESTASEPVKKLTSGQIKLNSLLVQEQELRRTIKIYKQSGLDTTRLEIELEKTRNKIKPAEEVAQKENTAQKEAEKSIKATTQLQTKFATDLKLIQQGEKDRKANLEDELKIREKITKQQEVLAKLESYLPQADASETKLLQTQISSTKENIASYKIELQEKLNKKLQKEFEEKSKIAELDLRLKAYAENRAVSEKELAYLNIQAAGERYKLAISELDKKQALLDIQKEQVRLAKIETEEANKKLKADQKREKNILDFRTRQASLIENETERERVLAQIKFDSKISEMNYMLQKGEMTNEQYVRQAELEVKLHDKTMAGLSDVGQMTKTITNAMSSGMQDFFNITSDGFADLGKLANNVLNAIIQQMIATKVVSPLATAGGNFLSDLVGNFFADGGVMTPQGSATLPVKTYSNGGVASSPQLAIYGEGRMNEAYVPLPDGRTIPVTIKSNTTTSLGNIKVQIINQTSSEVDDYSIFESLGKNQEGEEERILTIVLKGVATNKMNARTALKQMVG